jgi:isoleucyl-tRNA synthetase
MSIHIPEPERILWQVLFNLREVALPGLEQARQAKHIGKSLDAKLKLEGSGDSLNRAKGHLEDLRELVNVSQLEIVAAPQTEEPLGVRVGVTKAEGQKCERCWHWETDIGQNPEHPTICGRCVQAVSAEVRAV